jgi:glycosyltransferase involved in cell wall biosynthesis
MGSMISARLLDKYRLAAMPYVALERIGLAPRPRVPVSYVVERANWSTRWDGGYICGEIEKLKPGTAEVVDRPERLLGRIVHFGSQFQWVNWAGALSRSNRFIATYFHGKPEDDAEMARHIDAFLTTVPQLSRVVTAAKLIEDRLLAWGVPREKLVRIPIGVDRALFRPSTAAQRQQARARLGIGDDQFVLGSFQKDGVGWGAGDDAKPIKGPDILLDVAARVSKKLPLLVLLTGPARGFVRRGLERLGIPYVHEFLEDYRQLPNYYAALDAYLNPSREEGGPKGIIEAMAAGVPVISSRVGMAPELIQHRATGWIAEPGDVQALSDAVLECEGDPSLRSAVVAQAQRAVAVCDWAQVGRRHYEEVYLPVLTRQGC